ncbi:MAG: hypothetical protein ACEY3L_12095 [Wolbachia sp.]
MFKSAYPHPMPTNICSVNDMVRVNLFTKLDDCKVNKSKLIHDKCGKDLGCKIDDNTMNELKKCFKFEIDDKTKNEIKESIKTELEKGLKFEISGKTKNEIKESIKNELEKSLKFKISDDTKDDLKQTIKDELRKELDTKNKLEKPDPKNELEKPETDNNDLGYSEGMAFSHHGYGNDLI